VTLCRKVSLMSVLVDYQVPTPMLALIIFDETDCSIDTDTFRESIDNSNTR